MSPRLRALALPFGTAALATAVFARVVTFDFAYDDRWTLVDNAWLGRPVVELTGMLASGAAVTQHVPDATRPLMVLGHALERRLFALSPLGYHLDSLLLYVAVCALATRLVLVLSRQRHVALVAGCFFALAPLHAEVVAAINFREDLWAALGTLGALSMLAGPVPAPGEPETRRWARDAIIAAGCFGVALLGKESGLAFVPIALVTAYCLPRFRRRILSNRSAIYGLGAVLALWLLWRLPLLLRGDELPLAPARPLTQQLLRTARFEVWSVRNALFPFGYAPDHWKQAPASGSWVLPFLSLIAGVLVLGLSARTRVLAFGVGLALAAPIMTCPLLRPVNEIADRYFFLGVLGGGIVWGWTVGHVARAIGRFRQRTLGALACAVLLVPTWRATSLWRDERSLWLGAVAITPESPRAWAGLSRVYRLAGDPVAADLAMQRALGADPNYSPALVTEVYNDLAFGRVEQAREHLKVLDARRLGDGGGIGKARHCAGLERDAAAKCIAQ